MNTPLVEARDLTKHFRVGKGQGKRFVQAVNGVSFQISKGETLGLVGESGCGKTTVGRTILRLTEPTSGRIFFKGEDITGKNMREYRRHMQIIYQDPISSLDPQMTVRGIIGEPLVIQKIGSSPAERDEIIIEQLRTVGLNEEHMYRYPHEFSGGQRQRISIARALTVKPEFIVCDEPVSALDVSIQAQVINMLMELQQRLELTYLFIAHNLSVVRHISNRIGVMYLGAIVELTDSRTMYKKPLHPYTAALLSAVPIPDPKVSRNSNRILLEGDVPSQTDPPSGCCFRTRCPYAREICANERPTLAEIEPAHFCACHKITQEW